MDPIPDETIDAVVKTAEAAEILAEALHLKFSVAMRTILKSMQIMQQLESGKRDAALKNFVTTKRPQ